MKPVLSHDSRYITMLSMSSVYYGGKLNRLDLMTGELLHLEQPGHASWASYNLELDKFFYCYKYGALYSINPDGSELVQHFSGYDADANVSRTWDSRFLGIWTREAWEQNSCFVFDCLTGESFVIESIDYVAMNPMKAEISYSQESGDKVKLWRKDLESGDVMLIHGANYKGGDFISGYQLTNYRMDGKKMRFNAFVQTKVQAGFW
ncbi:MAG: hypothetical protein LRZ88_00720 [Candidatus Cloacimonetes bacterium]|nr:hypothetical protein [Candidatus Cloacimonadota bacterium]